MRYRRDKLSVLICECFEDVLRVLIWKQVDTSSFSTPFSNWPLKQIETKSVAREKLSKTPILTALLMNLSRVRLRIENLKAKTVLRTNVIAMFENAFETFNYRWIAIEKVVIKLHKTLLKLVALFANSKFVHGLFCSLSTSFSAVKKPRSKVVTGRRSWLKLSHPVWLKLAVVSFFLVFRCDNSKK